MVGPRAYRLEAYFFLRVARFLVARFLVARFFVARFLVARFLVARFLVARFLVARFLAGFLFFVDFLLVAMGYPPPWGPLVTEHPVSELSRA